MKGNVHQVRSRFFKMGWMLSVLLFCSSIVAQDVKKALERGEVPELYRW